MVELIGGDSSRPRVPEHICGRCRKEFVHGDRVQVARIFDRKGVHPADLALPGAYIYDEFELVHIDCRDPALVKGIL